MKKIALALCVTMALGACTSTQKVNVMQPGDRMMSCAQIKEEFVRLDNIKTDAQNDQGVNVANAAALVLFWPAIAGNYLSARDAMQLVEQRRTHLMTFYNDKNCENPANADLRFPVPASLLAPIGRGMH